MFIIDDTTQLQPIEKTHWEFTDCKSNRIVVDLEDMGDYASFTIVFHNTLNEDTRSTVFEVFTNEELTRRCKFLDDGKCPSGKWTGRNGKRICYENCE